MIIRCPSCEERISNKNTICPHCEYDLQGEGEGLSYDEATRRKSRETSYLLAMHSYAALAVTTVGGIWSWLASNEMSEAPGFWPTATLAAGALWYIGVRVLMIYRRMKGA